MRIVVLGATGNVGTALLARLASEDVEVVGIARRRPDLSDPLFAGVEWHSIDIGVPAATGMLERAFCGADAVVHLAWALQPNRDAHAMVRTNVGGLRRVVAATGAAGVPHLVYASSVGAYSPASKAAAVDESWPTGGIHTSHYARQKALNERILDVVEAEHPDLVVTRMRPGIILQESAPAEIGTLFLGPLTPKGVIGRLSLPVFPLPVQMVFQAVHADDVADGYWRAIERRAGGAFNLAGSPVLSPSILASVVAGARWVPMRRAALRAVVSLTWRLHLQRTDPGWIDLATMVPVLSTGRAEQVLGWRPSVKATDALRAFLDALTVDRGLRAAPPLAPRETLAERVGGGPIGSGDG